MALFLLGGTVLALTESFWYALPVLLIGIALTVGYILLGTIQSAAQKMQVMDFVGAEKRLGLTFFPKLLYKPNRAYYHLIKGTIAMNLKRTDEAEQYFIEADRLGLPSDNERAMIGLQLAGIYAQKNQWPAAQKHFQEVKKMKVTEPQIKEQIADFEKAFKQRGQMKHARTGQQMRGGGKRRRPRMR